MSEAKTRPGEASVADHIASRAGAEQQADCQTLVALMSRATGQGPKMWGPSIVGFGAYRYTYDSGRSGEASLAGFAIRGKELVVYLAAEAPDQAALLARLGKHKAGKACLYLKRLSEVDLAVLEQLVRGSVAEVQRRYPTTAR
jgi:hypothetical protein